MSKSNHLSEHDAAILQSIFEPELNFNHLIDSQTIEIGDTDEDDKDEIHHLELEAIKLTEAKEYEKAIKLFNELIKKYPTRASLFNNRAQLFSLQNKIDDAKKDIEMALSFCENKTGKVYCMSLCQSGLIKRKEKKIDEAIKDFQIAAKLGNKFAKSQLAELNPYAKLCNAMIQKVIQEQYK